MALDLSYIIPIFCRRVFHNHPDVMFKPGPYYMGDGWMGLLCNCICISWTLFVCIIFSIPTNLPVTDLNMNYASVSFLLTFYQTISLNVFLQGDHRRSYCICLVSFASIFTIYLRCSQLWVCSVWYFAAAHKHYKGPKSNLNDDSVIPVDKDFETKE